MHSLPSTQSSQYATALNPFPQTVPLEQTTATSSSQQILKRVVRIIKDSKVWQLLPTAKHCTFCYKVVLFKMEGLFLREGIHGYWKGILKRNNGLGNGLFNFLLLMIMGLKLLLKVKCISSMTTGSLSWLGI